MLGLLGLILPGLFTTINGITNAITNEKIAALNAKTDQERIAAEERVTSLQAQRDVLIADSAHSNLDIWMRTIIASGPAFILCKIFFYDKLGYGTTDIASNDPLWNVIMAVIGFYFLNSMVSIWAKSK
jgi:hypothetical protein